MVSVSLIFRNRLFREGMKRIIESEPDYQVIAEMDSLGSNTSTFDKKIPDIALMELDTSDSQKPSQLEYILSFVKVIVLSDSDYNEPLHQEYALKGGIKGYLPKDTDEKTLIHAIKTVSNNSYYVHPKISHQVIKKYRSIKNGKNTIIRRHVEHRKPFHLLTRRECQVLQLLAEGKNNRGIAEALYISEKTVKNHVSHVLEKMNVTGRTQAVYKALENGWVEIK